MQSHDHRGIGLVAGIVLLIGAGMAHAGIVGTTVPGTANGVFGQFSVNLVRDVNGGDFVPFYVFDTPGSITFTASGLISLNPSGPASFQDISPDGSGSTFTDREATLGSVNAYTPIEEQLVDMGAALPTVISSGDLLGAFVPEPVAGDPTFVAKNSKLTTLGIPADALFRIGSGPYSFAASEPGTLFLGVNDPLASNNGGAFEITVVPLPAAAPLLGVALGAMALARRMRRRSADRAPRGRRG